MRTPTVSIGHFLRIPLIAGVIAAFAFSVQAQERASATEAAKAVAAPLVRAAPVQADSATVPSAAEPQKEKGGAPQVTFPPSPDKPIPHVALLLPLASKTFAKVAEALKQGFLAGAEADGKNAAAYRIYSTDDEGAAMTEQYRKAVAEGASAIIGGVTRDGANMIVRESRLLPTLALNAPAMSSEGDLPDRFFYISLSLDLEAKLVARMIFGDGLRNVALVTSTNAFAKRIQESFEQECLRLGCTIVAHISFGSETNDATRVATAMEKINEKVGAKADAVFLAADPAAARYIRPYLPTGMPVFATSHTVDPRAEAIANLDLENVRSLEMPWFVERDHPAVMAYAKPAQTMPIDYERLFALGVDAWRLGQLIAKTEEVRKLPPLDGVTGKITLDGHQFTRALSSVEVRDGRTQLYRPTE